MPGTIIIYVLSAYAGVLCWDQSGLSKRGHRARELVGRLARSGSPSPLSDRPTAGQVIGIPLDPNQKPRPPMPPPPTMHWRAALATGNGRQRGLLSSFGGVEFGFGVGFGVGVGSRGFGVGFGVGVGSRGCMLSWRPGSIWRWENVVKRSAD